MINQNVQSNKQNLYLYSTYHYNHLTDSTTLTTIYMAVSMVTNILTNASLVSLLILNVLLGFRQLSTVLLKKQIRAIRNETQGCSEEGQLIAVLSMSHHTTFSGTHKHTLTHKHVTHFILTVSDT